jgi:hypothetical protein
MDHFWLIFVLKLEQAALIYDMRHFSRCSIQASMQPNAHFRNEIREICMNFDMEREKNIAAYSCLPFP